eukprot:6051794-Alexandrium_andersonii.AAC.1
MQQHCMDARLHSMLQSGHCVWASPHVAGHPHRHTRHMGRDGLSQHKGSGCMGCVAILAQGQSIQARMARHSWESDVPPPPPPPP